MVEVTRDFHVDVEVYRDTNKQTWTLNERFDSADAAALWLLCPDGTDSLEPDRWDHQGSDDVRAYWEVHDGAWEVGADPKFNGVSINGRNMTPDVARDLIRALAAAVHHAEEEAR